MQGLHHRATMHWHSTMGISLQTYHPNWRWLWSFAIYNFTLLLALGVDCRNPRNICYCIWYSAGSRLGLCSAVRVEFGDLWWRLTAVLTASPQNWTGPWKSVSIAWVYSVIIWIMCLATPFMCGAKGGHGLSVVLQASWTHWKALLPYSLSIITPESFHLVSHWVHRGLKWLVGRGEGLCSLQWQ